MNKMLHTKGLILKENISPQTGIIDGIVGSTAVIDRMGDTIDQNGWDLKDYKENSVILWGHNVGEDRPPIAKALKVWLEDKGTNKVKLMFKVQFDLQDTFAAEIFRKIKDGFINAVSVGFLPTEWEELDPGNWFGGLKYLKQSLLELSFVSVPANPEALIQLNSFGAKDKRFMPHELKDLYPILSKEGLAEILHKDLSKEDKKIEKKEIAVIFKEEKKEDKDNVDMLLQIGEHIGSMTQLHKKMNEDSANEEGKAVKAISENDILTMKGYAQGVSGLCDDMTDMMAGKTLKVKDKKDKLKESENVIKIKEMLLTITKSGRVLSVKNEKKITEAVKLLGEVLSELDKEPVDDSEAVGVMPGTEQSDNSKNIIDYKDLGILPESESWDGPGEIAKASIEDLKLISAYFNNEKEEDKSFYKLTHHKADSHKAVWRGIASAMGLLLGAKGGLDIPTADRKGIYEHLAKHYKEFNKTVPDFKMIESQVLAGLQEEVQAITLDREDKHVVKLVKKAIDNSKKETQSVIEALKVLNLALSKVNSK